MSSAPATLIGASAIAMWSTLALLTTASGSVPPFQLTAMAFVVASGPAALKWLAFREDPRPFLRKPAPVWPLGVLSYAAPLLSTILLIASGRAQPTPALAAACALIVGGAVVAAPRRQA